MNGDLTQSQEDYLETVLLCARENGHAHVKEIAEYLNVRMASVTGALRTLSKSGLVNYEPYGTVTLTEEGAKIASSVQSRHALLERFMRFVLGLDAGVARENACRMEHTMDDRALERMTSYMEFIENCPLDGCTWQEERGGFCRKADEAGCK